MEDCGVEGGSHFIDSQLVPLMRKHCSRQQTSSAQKLPTTDGHAKSLIESLLG